MFSKYIKMQKQLSYIGILDISTKLCLIYVCFTLDFAGKDYKVRFIALHAKFLGIPLFAQWKQKIPFKYY